MEPSGEGGRRLEVLVVPADLPPSPRELMFFDEDTVVAETPLGEGTGRLRVLVWQSPPFWPDEVNGLLFTCLVSGQLGERRVRVRLDRPIERPDEWSQEDLILVRRVAGAIERPN